MFPDIGAAGKLISSLNYFKSCGTVSDIKPFELSCAELDCCYAPLNLGRSLVPLSFLSCRALIKSEDVDDRD